MAISLAEDGNMEEALPLFQRAVNSSPKEASLYENLGVTQMRMGMLDEAKVSLTKAKRIIGPSSYGTIHDNLAALEEHIRFRNENPEGYEASNVRRPQVDTGDEDNDDGLNDGDEENEDDSDDIDEIEDSSSFTNRAIALAESGDLVGSLALFQSAVRQDPISSQNCMNLGVTQMRLGKKLELYMDRPHNLKIHLVS
jgi:tetratricopeptide (TPR) repeat protein